MMPTSFPPSERPIESAHRSFLPVIVSVALVACPSASAAPRPAASASVAAHDTLHLFVGESPASLNPLLARNVSERDLARLVYDTLLVPDAANRLVPHLARIVPSFANGGITPDGKTITFRLRKDVRWQDGERFTSADVAFTFATVEDPNVDVPERGGFERIVKVATPDPFTAVVTLREPFAPFVALAGVAYPIVPKHLLEHSADPNRDPIGQHPVGTGPYRFVRWDRGSRIDYEANDEYFGGAPKIRNVSVSEIPDQNTVALALQTHQIDFGRVDPPEFERLRRLPDLRAATEPVNIFVGYALNTERPLLRDVRIRRAISMAIDRASIAKKATFGTGVAAYADLPAEFWTAREPANPFGYRPSAANALLDAAGWKRGQTGLREKNGVPLRLQGIDWSGSKTGQSIDLLLQQMLRDVGIALSMKYYGVSLYFESMKNGGPLATGSFDVAAFSQAGGVDPENDDIYTCANREPVGNNVAYYCSQQMDALQRDSLATLDPARRAADVVKIERLAVSDVPYIFMYYPPWRIVWNPQLSRAHSDALGVWPDLGHWDFRSRPVR
jgi:peptide/nickel transport system substrate-binding protein